MHRIRNAALMGGMAVLAACGSTGTLDTPRATTRPTSPAYDYTPPTTADRAWVDDVITTGTDIASTLDGITSSANSADISGTISLCEAALQKTVGWEASFDAIPEVTVRIPARSALGEFRTAFQQCADGDFSASADTMSQASSYLEETTAAVKALG